MEFFRKYKFEIIIFCTALAGRLIVLAFSVLYYGESVLHLSDSGAYIDLARSIVSGAGFSRDGGLTLFTLFVPGYPLFLAASLFLFNSLWPALFGQIILSSFVPVFLFRMSEYFSLSRRLAFLASAVVALEPHLVIFSIVYMSEALYGFLFVLFVFLFARFLKNNSFLDLALSGFFLGISIYVRPVSNYILFISLCIAAYQGWRSRIPWRSILFRCAVLSAIVVAVILPWMWRNYRYFGVWAMSSHGSYNLYIYDGASVVSLRDGVSYETGKADRVRELKKDLAIDPSALYNNLRYERAVYEKSLLFFVQNKFATAKLIALTVISFWTSHNYAYFLTYFYHALTQPTYAIPPTQLLFQGKIIEAAVGVLRFLFSPYYVISFAGRLLWLGITITAFAGLWKLWRENKNNPFILFVGLLFFYFSLISFFVGLGIDGRQRYPVEPFIIVATVAGVQWLWKWRNGDTISAAD